MRQLFRKTLSALTAAALLCALALPAAASEALGEDLTAKDTQLHDQTQLSTNVFWSTAYSDRRTENLITYSPNGAVVPIVTAGSVLTSRSTVTSAARELEAEGYRVVAGINGDFFNVNTGLPIGIVVTDGELRSSDAGYYAIGFRADGTAILGKPAVTVQADLGYAGEDGAALVRKITGVNKARVSTGGIYLYTHDFNSRHTTGNTEAGVDVICTIVDGRLSIGESVTLQVEQVLEATSATAIGENQVVLSANLQSDAYYVDALKNIPVGSQIVLTATSANSGWDDVEYALGALYSLVENGAVVSGLQAGSAPRTAVGQKADGSLVFYTIDGRRSGHSIGATMTQVAQRLIELGCVTALCLDGGGSTTLTVTEPDQLTSGTINKPSDGSERSVTNQVFLVADSTPSGELSHFYVSADYDYVLAGSTVNISAAAIDTNFIPMSGDYSLSVSEGEVNGSVVTTPRSGGDIVVTAESRGREGTTTIHAIANPTDVVIRNTSSTAITTLSAAPGSVTQLTASAAYNRISLKADPGAFTWEVNGGIGTIDQQGNFTATTPGTGTITATAGNVTASVTVTVSNLALQTVEDFEGTSTIFRGSGSAMDFSLNHNADTVRIGSGSAKLDYDLTQTNGDGAYSAEWRASSPTSLGSQIYTSLSLWVYGDGSGNILSLLYDDGTTGYQPLTITALDFTGWKQVSVSLSAVPGTLSIQGLRISAPTDHGLADTDTSRTGTIYLDQIVASFDNIVDTAVPSVSMSVSGTSLTGTVTDAVDGVLPQGSITVTYDGKPVTFSYNASTGAISAVLPAADGSAHRVTITAKDASGNIGRASYDISAASDWTPVFSDTKDYWAATYVDYLYTAGITTGYAGGTFKPNQNITRAQFAVMLYRYLGLDESQYASVTLPFADHSKIADYALPAIKALYTEGIINGTTGSDGKLYFNPNSSLTRAQAATMIGRTQEKGYATAELTFTDAGSIPAYATYYIQTMVAQGVISGYTDGSFKPQANITRGQMAKILYTLM